MFNWKANDILLYIFHAHLLFLGYMRAFHLVPCLLDRVKHLMLMFRLDRPIGLA